MNTFSDSDGSRPSPSSADYPPSSGSGASAHDGDSRKTLLMALGSLGIVYGDIGTSPLYAVKECFHGHHAIALTPANILGVMSLIFWSLTMVVTIKYVIFIAFR